MCNTKCNDKPCCHEEDLLCCMPLMHCCGGYSEHNNCCPHDRCCNHPCCGCCDPCGKCDQPMCCCCYKLKKAFDALKEELGGEINNIRGRIVRIEQDIENKYNEIKEFITYFNENAVTEVTYNNTTKEITRTINNVTKKVVKILPYDEAVSDVNYNDSTKYITKTIGGNTTNVVKLDFVKTEDGVTDVSYDSSTKYLKKTINGQSSNIVKVIPYSEKGATNGVAPLDDSKKVPAEYLPSYVDDVIEGYYHTDGKFYYDQAHTNLITGESGKIYVNLANNKAYRWAPVGNSYVEISTYPSALPNPYALKVKKGSTTITYDGSAAREVTIPDPSSTPTTSNAVGNITFDDSTGQLNIYAVDGTLLSRVSLLWKKDGSTLTPVTSSNSVTANKFYDSSVN